MMNDFTLKKFDRPGLNAYKKHLTRLIFALFFIASYSSFAATVTWDGGGGTQSWDNANNWNPNSIPGPSDDVIIPDGSIVFYDMPTGSTIASLIVGGGASGTLSFDGSSARQLSVSGSITISPMANFNVAGPNQIHSLFIGGNLINNGTFDMRFNNNRLCNVTFNSAISNQTISGAGTITKFNQITINNTNVAPNNIVEINSSNFTNVVVSFTSGILKVSSGISLSIVTGAPNTLNIGTGSGFILDNPLAVANAGDGDNNLVLTGGTLELKRGKLNVNGGLQLNSGNATFNGAEINSTAFI
jgi:hypothetical protein